MSNKKGPKGFKRWILDNDGRKILTELMEDSTKKFNCILDDHLVEDWVIVREGETREEEQERMDWLKEKELEQMRRFYIWIKENYPEIKEEWSSNVATRG